MALSHCNLKLLVRKLSPYLLSCCLKSLGVTRATHNNLVHRFWSVERVDTPLAETLIIVNTNLDCFHFLPSILLTALGRFCTAAVITRFPSFIFRSANRCIAVGGVRILQFCPVGSKIIIATTTSVQHPITFTTKSITRGKPLKAIILLTMSAVFSVPFLLLTHCANRRVTVLRVVFRSETTSVSIPLFDAHAVTWLGGWHAGRKVRWCRRRLSRRRG